MRSFEQFPSYEKRRLIIRKEYISRIPFSSSKNNYIILFNVWKINFTTNETQLILTFN